MSTLGIREAWIVSEYLDYLEYLGKSRIPNTPWNIKYYLDYLGIFGKLRDSQYTKEYQVLFGIFENIRESA